MMQMLDLTLKGSGVQTKDVTAVEVSGSMVVGNETYRHFCSEGSAKRHYKDRFDGSAGALLAFARALRDVADELETRATYLIEEQ